jgi:hypothetical protein
MTTLDESIGPTPSRTSRRGYLAGVDSVDPKVARWREWIEGAIYNDIVLMHHRLQVWREVGEIVEGNARLAEMSSSLWDLHRDNYATTQAIAIRRQADMRRGTCSLARLVTEMRSNAQRFTREYFVGLWHDNQHELVRTHAHQAFDQLAGVGATHLDPAVPTRDLAELRRDAAAMKKYVDEHVAHDAAEPTGDLPTFDDMNQAVDALGRARSRLHQVLERLNGRHVRDARTGDSGELEGHLPAAMDRRVARPLLRTTSATDGQWRMTECR